MIYIERMRKGPCQSDPLPEEMFKGNIGESSERWGGEYIYGLYWAGRYNLELNSEKRKEKKKKL